MRWTILLLAAAAVAGAAPPAESVLPGFIAPDTRVVVGIQLRRILDSPLGKGLTSGTGKFNVPELAGLDLMRDVDELIIATNAEGDNPPGLMVLIGRFHPVGARSYHNVPVVETSTAGASLIAFLDESTAIAGKPADVHAAIDHRDQGASAAAGFASRAGELASRYDIWAIGSNLPKTGHGDQVDAVDGFSFGAALGEGLALAADIHLRSQADADKIGASLKLFEAMVKSQSSSAKFSLEAKGSTVQLSLFIPEAELKKAIEAQKTAVAAALAQGMATAQRRPAAPPKREGKILTDTKGDTVQVTLPGGHE
jgi:hypothetical protein